MTSNWNASLCLAQRQRCDFKLERQLVLCSGGKTCDGCVVTSSWNASWWSVQGGKTYDGCVATSNWNASWCSAQGGKTYDGCVVTSNIGALLRVARLVKIGTPRLVTDAL